MPQPGDQHRESAVTANPFLPAQQQVQQWTAIEIATLQARLDKRLGPEFISTRPGAGGGKLHYLAADKVISLANEVFGFNGWSSSIQNIQVDFVDENAQTGRITLGLSAIVRVTLRDGTFHEDMGYGHIENCKGKAAAFEKSKKEAVTDALKRALRNFGNVLGNCLYDKDYLQKITKIKVTPRGFDEENLYRHRDVAQKKEEKPSGDLTVKRTISVQSNGSFGTAIAEDDFDAGFFDDTDFTHPDAARADESPNTVVADPKPPELVKPVPIETPLRQVTAADEWTAPAPREPPAGIPDGFVSGKAAALLEKPPELRPSQAEMAFDPHRESPSIPKTAGVNTGKSEPIKHTAIKRTMDFVNPANNPNRRVGAPQTPAYRSPSVKRPALADVSNVKPPEPKKTKLDSPLPQAENAIP